VRFVWAAEGSPLNLLYLSFINVSCVRFSSEERIGPKKLQSEIDSTFKELSFPMDAGIIP
jgi:hypothetical protein